jgi:hypothetical protein
VRTNLYIYVFRNNVTGWSDMYTRGFIFSVNNNYNSPTKHVGFDFILYVVDCKIWSPSGHNHYLERDQEGTRISCRTKCIISIWEKFWKSWEIIKWMQSQAVNQWIVFFLILCNLSSGLSYIFHFLTLGMTFDRSYLWYFVFLLFFDRIGRVMVCVLDWSL